MIDQLSPKPNILVVDDIPQNLLAIEVILADMDVNIVKASSGRTALGLTLEYDFALVLLDVQMPGMDGFETASLIRGIKRTRFLPIIFLTAIFKEEQHVLKGYEAGAVDYLLKPLDPHALKSKVRVFIDLYWQKKSLENSMQDLTVSKKAVEDQNKLLKGLSIRDGLTGLYNHHHMDEVLVQEFMRARRYRTDLSCLLFDLDYFKVLNNTYGHRFGDYVLKEFAKYLQAHTRISDFCFRYGGEEFLVLLPQTDLGGAQIVAEKIRKLCQDRVFEDEGDSTTVTTSIGVATLNYNLPSDSKELVAFADKALYRAKAEGRNRVKSFKQDQQDLSSDDQGAYGCPVEYLKESLSSVLENTRRAALESLELLVQRWDDSYHENMVHNQQVIQYIDFFGAKLQFAVTELQELKRAAKLHDWLKIILKKQLSYKSEPLSQEDITEIKKQPALLAEFSGLFDCFSQEKQILLHHHEKYDGSGYPENIEGDKIPVGARMLAIVDAFVAMKSDRPYREKLSDERVIQELTQNAGTQFDPQLALYFLEVIEENELVDVPPEVLKQAKQKVFSKLPN